jgi:hypothetical protein
MSTYRLTTRRPQRIQKPGGIDFTMKRVARLSFSHLKEDMALREVVEKG